MINTVMFIFFALLDLSMVGLCSYCYSGKEKYSEGMILGVHVPSNAEEDEAVSSLTQKYRNGFRRSQRLNLAAGFLIPAVCFSAWGSSFPSGHCGAWNFVLSIFFTQCLIIGKCTP